MGFKEQENVENDALKVKVFELYKSGRSYRAIAKDMGVSKTTVHNYIKAELENLAEYRKELGEKIVDAELERLNRMVDVLDKKLKLVEADPTAGSAENVSAALIKVMDRRARYLGLNAPDKKEVSGSLTLEQLLSDDDTTSE